MFKTFVSLFSGHASYNNNPNYRPFLWKGGMRQVINYTGTSYVQLVYNLPRYFNGEHCSCLNIVQMSMESVRPVHVSSGQHLLLHRDAASVRTQRRAMAQAVGWPKAIHGGSLAPVSGQSTRHLWFTKQQRAS